MQNDENLHCARNNSLLFMAVLQTLDSSRGNKSLLCLPKVKTEMLRKSFRYQGATIFNKLPRELREKT